MDEEEIDSKYDDADSTLVKDFLRKKEGRNFAIQDTKTEEEFLTKARKLRVEYEKDYDNFVRKKERQKERALYAKETKAALSPVVAALKAIARALHFLFVQPVKFFFRLLLNMGKGAARKYNSLAYRASNYYLFHLRRFFYPMFRRFRLITQFLSRPIERAWGAISDKIKAQQRKFETSMQKRKDRYTALAKKVWGLVLKASKEWYGQYSAFTKKVFGPVKSFIDKIKPKPKEKKK